MAKTRYNIIEITHKKTGRTYIYEDYSYWNKEKGYSTHKRKSIGKIDENGNRVYNKYYKEKLAAIANGTYTESSDEESGNGQQVANMPSKESETPTSPQDPPTVSYTVMAGQKMVLDKVCSEVNLRQCLLSAFSVEETDSILALAYYVVCQGKAFSRSEDWLVRRGYSQLGLTSQRISDLLGEITDDKVNAFFKSWIRGQKDGDSMLFDITSISTYGKSNAYAERGYNRDHEDLEQINMAYLTSVSTGLPMWYCITPGSMADVAVLDYVLGMLKKLDIRKFTFFGDRGFYSDYNLRQITDKGHKFTVPVPSHVGWQKKMIAQAMPTMLSPENVIELDNEGIIYGQTIYKKTDYGRTWYHIYYDQKRKQKIVDDFMLRLRKCKDELEAGTEYEKNKDIYERYLTVKETPKRGRKVDYNHQAIEDFINNDSCYWVLMSTTQKDKKKALLEYRDRNGVEVNFDDVKNSMDLRRMRNHSERTIKGKIFVIFIALILLTKLRVMVQSTPQKDRHYWTERDFLEKVASFSKVHFEGKYKDVYSVPTSSQRFVFDKLEIPYTYKGKMFNEKGGEKKVDAQAYKANTNGNAESKNNQTADELGST